MKRCKKVVVSAVYSIFVCCVFIFSAFAEDEPLRGRLPDGRAFRTDSQGVQIVDYIAELELSIEALNRRVQGLEDELQECNENGGNQGGAKKEVIEKDIFAEQSTNNNQQVFDLQQKLRACEAKAKESSRMDVAYQPSTCEAELQAKSREVALLETSLNDYKKTVASLKLKAENGDADASKRELVKIKGDFEAYKLHTSQELKNKQGELDKANKWVCKKCDTMRVAKARAESPMASFVLNNDSTFAPIRGQLQSEYNKLHSAIKVRDAKFKQYRAGAQRVTFSLSPLRSANRRSLESIKYGIWHENDLQALTSLRADIRQISISVNDDIALIDRMMKIK